MLKILSVIIGIFLLISLPAGAQSPPPSDFELMQARAESAEAQAHRLRLMALRMQFDYEAQLDTVIEWLKAAQESKTSAR